MRGGRPERNRKDEHRTNENIKEKEVRLIGSEGEQIGVVSIADALERASDAGLDLVEISPNVAPPVCKVMDYGKFKFQQQKKASEAKKKQHVVVVKEISIRAGTEEHDYQIKLRKMREFIEKGNKVKVNLRFRGREMAHQDLGVQMMQRIMADMEEIAKIDSKPRLEGRQMNMMMSPLVTPSKK